MFARAGGSTDGNKSSTKDATSSVLSQLATALLPRTPTTQSSKSSPGKVIENRSKCYRQLGELKNLRESGLISETEYVNERECIMGTLKNLAESNQ